MASGSLGAQAALQGRALSASKGGARTHECTHTRTHTLTPVHARARTRAHTSACTATHTSSRHPTHRNTHTHTSACSHTHTKEHVHSHTHAYSHNAHSLIHVHDSYAKCVLACTCLHACTCGAHAYAFPHIQCTHMCTACKCVHTCLHASARVHVHRSPMCAMHTHARALMHMCKAHMQMHTHMCESTCTQLTSTCAHAHTCMCMRECAPGGLPCSSPSTSRGAGPPGSGTWTELCAEWSPDQPPPERAGRGRLLEETGVPPAPGGPRHSAPPAQEGCENTDSGPGVRWAMERGTQHPERTRPLLPTSVRPFRPGAGPRRLRSAPPLPRVDAAAALGLAVAQLCSGPF